MLFLSLVLLAAAATQAAAAAAGEATSGTGSKSSRKPKSKSAYILFVAPFGSQSHKNFYDGIIQALANDGHKITVLTPFKTKPSHANIEDVLFPENDISPMMANSFVDGVMAATFTAMEKGPTMCFSALASQSTTMALLKGYDLVFVSIFFNECFLGAVHAIGVPVVFVNPSEMFGPYTARRMGNPTFPSFSYNPMLNYEPPLSLPERFVSAMSEIVLDWMIYTSFNRIDLTGQSLGLFPVGTPSTADISANASLMFVNSVRLAEHPRPYMPNVVLAGGIHCRAAKPLPKELEEWAASAGPAGVIYFSIGSAVPASQLPEDKVKVVLSVFGKLPQKVLWKHDKSKLEGMTVPSNVRLTKWAPQQDLLGDSRLRLFITHGGLLSTQEATYHGVPVLGLPVFGDQEGNMAGAEAQGWGIKLSWETLTEENFRAAIDDLIDNPEKRRSVKRRKALMQDSPLTPQQSVVWWTNYLLRTGGAPHLRSPAAALSWYHLYNTDMWLALVSSVLLLLWLLLVALWKLLKFCFRCRGPSSNKTTKKQKRN